MIVVSSFITINRRRRRIAQWSVWKSRKNSYTLWHFFKNKKLFTFLEFAKKRNENGYKIAAMRIVACSSFISACYLHKQQQPVEWPEPFLYASRSWSFISVTGSFSGRRTSTLCFMYFLMQKIWIFFLFINITFRSCQLLLFHIALRPFHKWNEKKLWCTIYLNVWEWASEEAPKKKTVFI